MSTPPVGQARRGWVTPTLARAYWPDAPKSPEALDSLLDAAYEVATAYAPHLAAPTEDTDYDPPQRCVHAQVLHARAIWTAARAKADGLGLEDATGLIASTTPTLTGQVKQLLRPTGGIPAVG